MEKKFRASLVGRTSELQRLEATARVAAAGSPSMVLVGGEAGIGKTWLLEELLRRAATAGNRVLLGHCLDLSGGGLPYGPVIEAGRTLARTLDEPASLQLLRAAEAELSRMLQLPGDGRTGHDPAPAFAQTRLFEYLFRILSQLCRQSPVLLAAEDLHLADRSTLDLLSFLFRNVRDEPVMFIVTYRSDELRGRPAVRAFLADHGRDRRTHRIELAGFGREELIVHLEHLLDASPSEEVVERILARSGGNPFFIDELVACSIGGGDVRLPEKLSAVIITRLERLSEDAREVLRIVAAADRPVSHRLIAIVAERPERALLQPLREAVDSRMLVADTPAQSYSFRHALVREAIYADLQPAELAWLHAAIARALEGDPTLTGPQVVSPAVELAHHWEAAGDRPRALVASVEAGRSAAAIFAFTEAHRQFERALGLWRRLPDAPERAGLTHDQLLEEASDAAVWAVGVESALKLIGEALAEVDPVQEPARAGALLECQGRYLWRAGNNERSLAAHAESARLLAAEPASPVRARTLAGYGRTLMIAGRYSEARSICQEAVAIARTIGARREEGHARNTLGVARTMTGDVAAGIEDLHEARRIAEEVGSFEDLYRAYSNLALALENGGRLGEAVEMALAGLGIARKLPTTETAAANLLVNAVDQLFLLGRWYEARELLASAPHVKAMPRFGPFLNRTEAELDTATGQFDLAEARLTAYLGGHTDGDDLASGLTDPLFEGPLHAWRAELAIWRRDYPAARAAVEEGLQAVAQSEEDRPVVQLCALGLRAAADEAARALEAGDHHRVEAARSSGAKLLDHAHRLIAHRARQGWMLPELTWGGLLCEAEHARLEGRPDSGRWEVVATASDALQQPYRAAYARWRQAEALLARGAVGEAKPVLRQAHEIVVRLAAKPLRELVESLAQRYEVDLTRTTSTMRAN